MDSQSKQVSEYATRMEDYDKKFEENSRRFGSMLAVSGKNVFYKLAKIFLKLPLVQLLRLQELNKCKTELQYYRSRSHLMQVSIIDTQ